MGFLLYILFWTEQDEWTGEQKLQYTDVSDDIEPEEIRPMGNYAVSITWPDGFSQVKKNPFFKFPFLVKKINDMENLMYEYMSAS